MKFCINDYANKYEKVAEEKQKLLDIHTDICTVFYIQIGCLTSRLYSPGWDKPADNCAVGNWVSLCSR